MATERKLDIFRVLAAADNKDTTFYDKLTVEEEKAFVPLVVARWMSGTSSAKQVYFLNELVNPFVFSLSNHKQLLWDLLTICNVGKKQRYVWNALPGKKNTSKPTAARVVKEYYGYSMSEAVNALPMFTREDLITLAEELGWQSEDIAKIKKEVKASPNLSTQPEAAPDTNNLLEF